MRSKAPAWLVGPGMVLAVALGSWPAVSAIPRLETYSMHPAPALLLCVPCQVLLALLVVWRWNDASRAERRGWSIASVVVVTSHALWISTLGLQILFVLHYSQFEAARLEARAPEGPGVEGWVEDVRIGSWQFDAVGQTGNFYGPPLYFAAETNCGSIGSGSPSGAEIPPHMGFRFACGSGFYYPEPGAPYPSLNQSATGRLVGGWWWYVDD